MISNANDFEILGACLRREVEFFLYQLAQVHQFKAGIPKNANLMELFGDPDEEEEAVEEEVVDQALRSESDASWEGNKEIKNRLLLFR